MGYAVIIEKGPTSFGAHVPDLPGCVAAAETREEVYALILQAIEMYVAALMEYVAALMADGRGAASARAAFIRTCGGEQLSSVFLL